MSSYPSSLQPLVSNRLAYVDIMTRVGGAPLGSAKNQNLLTETVGQVIGALKSVKKLLEQDVIDIQGMLAGSNLSELQQTTILEALSTKVNAPAGDGIKQIFMCFDNYLTEPLVKLFDSNEDNKVKLKAAARHLLALKAYRMNEKSYAHCASVVLHKAQIIPDHMLLEVRTLKCFVSNGKPLDAAGGVLQFPEDVSAFILQDPVAAARAFADTPPMESPFDEFTRRMLALNTPCRCSNIAIQRVIQERRPKRGVVMHPKLAPAMGMLQDMQNS